MKKKRRNNNNFGKHVKNKIVKIGRDKSIK